MRPLSYVAVYSIFFLYLLKEALDLILFNDKEANYDKIIVYKNNDELRSLQGLSHVIGKIETNHPRANNQLEHLLNKLIKDKGMN